MADIEQPIVFGHRLRYLTPHEVEVRLSRMQQLLDTRGQWSEVVVKQGLFVDLSMVEWVDLGALVHLMILIESALRNSIHVKVALPLTELQRSERELTEHEDRPGAAEEIVKKVERRSSALRFLEYMNFIQALQAEHLRRYRHLIQFISNYDSSTQLRQRERGKAIDGQEGGTEPSEHLYRYCFPLQWFSGTPTESLENMAWFLAEVVGQPKRGLESIDANSIANVILYELVDNVHQHAGEAGAKHQALVTAWARPLDYPPRPHDFLEVERPFLEWVTKTNAPVVEILIGDSGRGISNALAKKFKAARLRGAELPSQASNEAANILLWAFDRWSSSRESDGLRGTRGLYRVDRVVRKYQGFITIRAYDQLAGWDHGGPAYDAAVVHGGQLSVLPGTFIRLRIPAFRESKPTWRATVRPATQPRFVRIETESIEKHGLTEHGRTALRRALESGTASNPECVVATLDAALEHPKGIEPVLEAVIKQAVELRHPSTLILVGLPGGWEAIEAAINSINEEHTVRSRNWEALKQDHFEIWDPVLVIGEHGEYGWAGVTRAHAAVLDALLKAPDGTLRRNELRSLLSAPEILPKERASVWRDFRNDPALFHHKQDGGLSIGFTIDGVLDSVSTLLVTHIKEGEAGVLKGSLFRTPSLLVVDKWLTIDKILESTCGTDLVMLTLAARARAQSWWAKLGNSNVLVADESVNSQRLRQLRLHLDPRRFRSEVMPGETGAPIPYGVNLMARGASALVYCDIILSGETVRRCLSQVLRDEAQPAAILCLFDARAQEGPIEMWGIEVPVVSVSKIDMLVERQDKPAVNMNPITREVESANRLIENSHKITDDLLDAILLSRNALHFTHVGRPIGRHFTFYLDVGKIMEDPAFAAALSATVDEWLHEQQRGQGRVVRELELWHASPVPKPPPPAKNFGDWIQTVRGDIRSRRTVRRESAYGRWNFVANPENRVKYPLVLIVDWGALTGTSIMQMIRLAAEAGAESILTCIFVSQLPPDDEAFLRSLKEIQITARQNQLTLPGLSKGSKPSTRTVDVAVRFLASLPFGVYDHAECPVCQQLARLSHEEYPTELLGAFSRSQREKSLRARTREELVNSTPRDFHGRELLPDSILWSVRFRQRLSEASVSTTARLEVLHEVIEMGSFESANPRVQRKVYDFIHFLSVESQWLRRAPLNFRLLRDQVADISLQVALDKDTSDFDRLNAIAVLRSSSKHTFARQIHTIFAASYASDVLARQVLYGVFTYLSRPYHQTIQLLRPLRDSLQQIRDMIDARQISVSREIEETVASLIIRVEVEYARAGYRDLTPSQAWMKLRREFGPAYHAPHNEQVKSADLLLPGPDKELIERSISEFLDTRSISSSILDSGAVSYLRGLESHWETCRRFLEYSVMPLLQHLRPILLSTDGRSGLGPDTASRFLEMLDSRRPLAEGEFSRLVRDVARDVSLVFAGGRWEKINSECQWLWDRVFRPGNDTSPPSRLIEFIRSAPIDLNANLTRAVEGVQNKAPHVRVKHMDRTAESLFIFCGSDLFRDLAEEIITNCEKHKRSQADFVELAIKIIETNGEEVIVEFRNSNTEESDDPGVGMRLLAKRLEAFGASLELSSRLSDGWSSFCVRGIFTRGERFEEAI